MSDITKKIHSIEPELSNEQPSEGRIKLKPLAESPLEADVPNFVKRRSDMNPTLYMPSKTGQGFIWTGVVLSLLWICLGLALLFTRGINVIQTWGTFEYLLVGVVIVMPATLILFLAMTLKKLSQTNTDALRLSDISAQLLKADETAAASATSLASAIRSSLNALDSDVARINTNLAHLKTDSTTHVEQLNEATTYALNASETVAQNFSSQKETFGAAHHALEDTLSRLTAEFDGKKDALISITEQAQTVTEKSAETLDQKLGAMTQIVKDISTKDTETSQKLSDFDHSALKAVQAFEDKIKQLDDITQKLNSENATFDMLVSSRAKELAQIADLNKMTDDTFTEYLERGKGLSMDLRTVTSSADQTITEHLAAFRSEIANGKKLSQQTLEALEATATESLEQYKAKTMALEEKIQKLQTSITDVDARVQQSAVTRELNLDIPSQRPKINQSNTPLTLKPLDVDVAPLEIEPIKAEFKTPVLDSPHPLEGPNKSVNITPDVITTDIAKNKKSLFGSSPKVSEPLELQEEDLVMPSPTNPEAEDPYALHILDEEQDLLKPLAETTDSLFGRKKDAPKSKPQWSWRDMLGGFDSRDDEVTESNMSIAESEKPLNPKRPFENMIDVMGIDPKRAVSEKLVSDISTAFVTDEALIKVIAVNGLTELSKYIKAHEQYGATYQSSAAYYEAQYKKTINPEIMNKDSINSHLSSNAGRHFIISLLG